MILRPQAGFTHAVFVPGASFYYLTGLRIHQSERLTLFGVSGNGEMALLLPRLEAEGITDARKFRKILTFGDEEGPQQALLQFANTLGGSVPFRKIAVEPAAIRLSEVQSLGSAGMVSLANGDGLVRDLRLIKDPSEIAALQKAAFIVDEALRQAGQGRGSGGS